MSSPDTHQFVQSTLSVLPESGTLKCRFNFVIIGPDAHAVVQKISEAELHTEVAAMATLKTGIGSTATQKSGKGTVRELNIHGDEQGTYTSIDASENTFARIRFDTMKSYEDSLPELLTAHNVRNTCYICLFDERMDVEQDVVSIVNKGFVEMGFNAQRLKKNGSEETPALRGLLLVHRGQDNHQTLAPENQVHLEDLSVRLENTTKGSPLRNRRRHVDFESSDELYECMDEIAKEMHSMVIDCSGTATTRFDDDAANLSRPCCVAQ